MNLIVCAAKDRFEQAPERWVRNDENSSRLWQDCKCFLVKAKPSPFRFHKSH